MSEAPLLTIKDVMRITRLSRTKIYELIRDGEFPVIRIGRSVRIRRETLKSWITDHERLDLDW